MTKLKERIYYWDNLKFILITLVVLGHFIEMQVNVFPEFQGTFIYIYLFHMPLFIFVTGFFSKRIINDEKNEKLNKIISYLILYILFTIMLYIIGYFFGYFNNFNFISNMYVPWYLLACVMWIIITSLIKNIKFKFILPFSIFMSLLIGYSTDVQDQFALARVINFYPFFLCGYYLNKDMANKFINKIHEKKYVVLSFLILALTCFVFIYFSQQLYFLRPLFTARNPYAYINFPIDFMCTGAIFRFMWLLFSTIICICLMAVVPRKKTFFSSLGARTLQIYVLHILVIMLILRLGIVEFLTPIFGSWYIMMVILISVVLTFLLSFKFLEIPFNKIMRLNFQKIYKSNN